MQEDALEITFHGINPSQIIKRRVREKFAKLERIHHNITSCRVAVELPTQKHHKGNMFQVRIDVELAGKLLVVDKVTGKSHAHEDVFVAIRDAFGAMRRRLQAYVHVRRGDVKHHEPASEHGELVQLYSDELLYAEARMSC